MYLYSDEPLLLRAGKVLTMNGPDLDHDLGIIAHQGLILELGPFAGLKKHWSGPMRDLGPGIILPGLINAHCHLELSHLHGTTPQGLGFPVWAGVLISQDMDALDKPSLDRFLAQAAECHTALIADITSRNPAMVRNQAQAQDLDILHFFEFFGYLPRTGDGYSWPQGRDQLAHGIFETRGSAAGHALYSTSPDVLAHAKTWTGEHGKPYSLHLAEHEDEIELLATGQGRFADMLRARVIPEDYSAPGCSPVEHARDLGLLDASTLAVHCVQLTAGDIDILAETGTSVCLCPRSNEYIGVGLPRANEMRRAGIPLCLGMDSPASNHDLDLYNELRFVLEHLDSDLDLHQAVTMLTRNPAKVLGLDQEYGTLAPGHRACFAVLPDDLADMLD